MIHERRHWLPKHRTGLAESPVATPRRTWKPALFMLSGLVVTPIIVLAREMVAADKCVARGGTYDYLRALCDMTGGSYVPFVDNYGPLVWVAALLFLKVTAVTLFAFWTPSFQLPRIPFLRRGRP